MLTKPLTLAPLAGVLLALVLSLGTARPAAGAETPTGGLHSCRVLVDAAHPWQSHVDGGNVETGNRWLTARAGRHGTCAFARTTIRKLLARPSSTYARRDHGHLLGGLCDWDSVAHHEVVRPFFRITCHVPIRLHDLRSATTVEAVVDPNPRFIH